MLDLFRRETLGMGDSGKAPTAIMVWGSPWSGSGEQICTQPLCNYIMFLDAQDSDNDITSRIIQISTDEGNTWTVLLTNPSNPFGDGITTGKKWYRAIVTDSEGHQVISNILKIKKQLPGMGDIVLVYNGTQHQNSTVLDPQNSIPMSNPENTHLALKNIHTDEYIECASILNNQNSVSFYKYGTNMSMPVLITPKAGEIILPGQEKQVVLSTGGASGLYVIAFTQILGQVNGSNVLAEMSWLVNVIDNTNS